MMTSNPAPSPSSGTAAASAASPASTAPKSAGGAASGARAATGAASSKASKPVSEAAGDSRTKTGASVPASAQAAAAQGASTQATVPASKREKPVDARKPAAGQPANNPKATSPGKASAGQAGSEKGAAKMADKATKPAKEAKQEKALHTEVPNRSDDYISRWNGARLKCIQNPNPDLKTEQIHVLRLPELCQASHNPMPGSSITISYRGKGRFLEVFSLSAYIQASIGHPIVRDVEALTQAIAIDCAQALGQKVEVDGLFELRGLAQTVMTEVVAKPRKPKAATEGGKSSRSGKGGKSAKDAKAAKEGKDAKKGDKKGRR